MIRKLIEEDRIEEALNELSALYDSLGDDSKAMAALRGRLAILAEGTAKDIISEENKNLERNRVRDSFLYFFENLEDRVNTVLGLKYDVKDFDNQVRLKMMRQYHVGEVLGAGSSAVIYKATELSSGKTVAVRALKDIKPTSDEQRKTAYHIKHRNIIEVLSSLENDIPFCIVLEYINGVTLDHLLEVGYFPKRDTVSIIRQLCDALYYLQNLDIPFHNLRPSKIIIDHELKPVISVFEIFKDMRGFTRLDKIMDDLRYSAPEELRNEPGELDNGRANQFMLGLLMYEMLTGDPLFMGQSVDEVMDSRRQFFGSVKWRRGLLRAAHLPKELQGILAKLLEEDPKNRFVSMAALDKTLYQVPIHGGHTEEVVHESYLRCCAKNRDFISGFYARLFREHADKQYEQRFGGSAVGHRTRKKLRVMLLQLIDVGNPNAPVLFSRINAYSGHAGLNKSDFTNFLYCLKSEIKNTDFLWNRDPSIELAWEEVIQKALANLP